MYVKDRTGHGALTSKKSLARPGLFQSVCKLISHTGVPGLLSLEPLWAHDQPPPLPRLYFPLSGRLSITPSSSLQPASSVSGYSLEVKGPLLPSPLASPFLPHRPLFLAQFISLWAGNSLGSGSGWEREGPAKSHSGSLKDLHAPSIHTLASTEF